MIKKLIKITFFFFFFIILSFTFYMCDLISSDIFISIVYALLLNYINICASLILFEKTYNKGNKIFLLGTMGGMGIRMFFLLIAIFVILKFIAINKIVFILIFFTFYFILLALEASYFHKKIKQLNIKEK